MRVALEQLYSQAQAIGFPNRLLPALKRAIIRTSIKYGEFRGPICGEARNFIQELFRDPKNQAEQYRLDTDNLAGCNFYQ
ncbi:MAG: hypothetical protein ACRD1X_07680 [Vicinamibacteria bacterium]